MGDFQGHPFRGNQWSNASSGRGGSGTSSRGDYQDPLSGEPNGEHTPAGMRKLIGYLEKETGEKFRPHGSVKGGSTSKNDFDIIMETRRGATEEEELRARREEAKVWDDVEAGKLTHAEAMDLLYADPGDKLTASLETLGFRMTREMSFTGNYVSRWHRASTNHTLELWMEGDAGDAESGPPTMWSRDYDPATGRMIKETRN